MLRIITQLVSNEIDARCKFQMIKLIKTWTLQSLLQCWPCNHERGKYSIHSSTHLFLGSTNNHSNPRAAQFGFTDGSITRTSHEQSNEHPDGSILWRKRHLPCVGFVSVAIPEAIPLYSRLCSGGSDRSDRPVMLQPLVDNGLSL